MIGCRWLAGNVAPKEAQKLFSYTMCLWYRWPMYHHALHNITGKELGTRKDSLCIFVELLNFESNTVSRGPTDAVA
jgi:hypothetical protein